LVELCLPQPLPMAYLATRPRAASLFCKPTTTGEVECFEAANEKSEFFLDAVAGKKVLRNKQDIRANNLKDAFSTGSLTTEILRCSVHV